MAETAGPFNVTAAFYAQLNTLCITEFPCGYGSWRAPNVSSNASLTRPTNKSTTFLKSNDTSLVTTGLVPENSAQLETVESLQELAMKMPYDVDCSWSNEAKTLREIAVKSPDQLTRTFILKFFKSLRIVDKKVTEIDEGLLQLKNLKQLTLSANLIRYIDSKRLPKGLQELELAANEIADISPLCICPPPLSHLGLGYNRISSIAGHMNATSWPHLLSLDLSFNKLSDLYNTINVLKTLPKLKNLVLQGNPLALVPGYRGYTIDSIRQLAILDDLRISADEKHFFKGLSKLKDVPIDEAQVEVSVTAIKGVRMPEEVEDPEINADYPKTEHKYHVEFQFLKGSPSLMTYDTADYPGLSSVPAISVIMDHDERNDQEEVPVSTDGAQSDEDSGLLETVATESLPWAEEAIELNFSKRFHTRLLVSFRDFIQRGIHFTVIKTKHVFVLEDPNTQSTEIKQTTSAKSRPGSKMQKPADKRKESAKGKEKEKGKDGKGKKSKQDDVELFELPRKHFILGSCHVSLAPLLEGELEVETEGVCEGEEGAGNSSDKKGEASAGKNDGIDKKKATKDQPHKQAKGNQRATTPVKGRLSHGNANKDDKKSKGKEKHDEHGIEDDEEPSPPTLITVQVRIKLVYWKSAREAQQEIHPHGMPSQTEIC